MLNLTELAKLKIRLMLQDHPAKEWAVRLRYDDGVYADFTAMHLKDMKPEEKILTFKRKKLLRQAEDFKVVLTSEAEEKLKDVTIDYIDGGAFGGAFEVTRQAAGVLPQGKLDFGNPTVKKIHELLQKEINPAIAMHGGFAELLEVKDNQVYLRLAGGCQGCGMADVTLRNGIELRIKEECPEIVEVIDETNHAGGTNPYYQAPH